VLSSRKPVQLTAAPVQAPAKPTATFVTDLPVPPTTSAEAAAEYAAGLQAFRDSSTFRSEIHFRRAAELDPTMAAALLRASLFARAFGTSGSSPYDFFVRAASLRSRLTPRDQELADALEPLLLRTRPDKPDAVRRLSAVVAKRPSDVELVDWLAIFSDGDPEVQLAIADRAIALDANDAQAENTRGLALVNLGRNAEARSAFERSTALASTATAGFRNLSELDAAEGRCEASLRNAGLASNRNPVPTMEDLAAAVALGRDDETLHEAITQQFSLLSDPRIRRVNELRVLAQIALVRGNFDSARRMANERLALVAQNGDLAAGFSFHYFSTEQLVRVAQESGDDAEARRLARSFVARAPAWAAGLPHSLPDTERLPWLQRLAAGDDAALLAAFEDDRAATTEERLADRAELPMRIWLYEYASAVQSRRDAEKALALLPKLSPSALPSRGSWMADARMGLTYAIADRPKDALPYLRRAADSCTLFHEPYLHMQATLRLGQALEATDDAAGACDAYQRVISRWGRAVPRSVTAERARERARRLGCGR
jgi:eukaryotic-like serine/threonine-protein kinase